MNCSLSFQGSTTPTPGFADRVRSILGGPLLARAIDTLQVNLGYRCNMACAHWNVSAGPGRQEVMDRDTVDLVLRVLQQTPVETLDITGGAPELNPCFRYLVAAARRAGKRVLVRSNLTILLEPGMEDLTAFYREQGVELIASLPCYLEENVNALRGSGAYAKSIEALRKLNALGFGVETGKTLSLVYNPGGAFLPPPQGVLEMDYRRELRARFGVSFTRLYTVSNMPIGRFRESLERQGDRERYETMLASAFNPATLDKVMCRTIVNVGWDGALYDCDFNQVLGTKVSLPESTHISAFDYPMLSHRPIATGNHCYGCTAGQGST